MSDEIRHQSRIVSDALAHGDRNLLASRLRYTAHGESVQDDTGENQNFQHLSTHLDTVEESATDLNILGFDRRDQNKRGRRSRNHLIFRVLP